MSPLRADEDLSEAWSLRLVRLRLVLAFLTVFVVPLAVAAPLVHQATRGRGAPLVPVALLVGLAVFLALLTYWMACRIVEPAEELDVARMKLRVMYERVNLEASLDTLTSLGNHRAFQEELDRQIEHAKRSRVPFSVVLLDLDDFKLINDSGGHAAGDAVLARMGAIARHGVRHSDRAFRIGGDEFALILVGTDAETARHVGRRLLATALDIPVGRSDEQPFSFSGGVATFPTHATDRPQLFRSASAALYGAKVHGRTTIEVFDPARHHAEHDSRTVQELAVAVRRVAAERRLSTLFQPILSMETGGVIGVEGLVRPGESSHFASSAALFAAAEMAGQTTELDLACIEVLVRAAVGLPRNVYLSLNVSPRTLEAAEFTPAVLARLLASTGIDPAQLVLELTEREAVNDFAQLRARIEDCRQMGIRIAADDVGAGNAGLRLLSQVRFDIVKIDLSLVQEGALRSSSLAVVRSLRDLAAGSNAMTVAEGVDTPDQLRLVQEVGIEAAQGYLLGRPASRLDFAGVEIDVLGLPSPFLRALASRA